MKFKKYQHVEKFGKPEVSGIELGTCYVFPKIDGTNASVWLDDAEKGAGSRRKTLELGKKDNAGFKAFVEEDEALANFFNTYPEMRLFGEWLVPHTLKTYKEDAWRKFYVFDVMVDDKYLPYETYQPFLEAHGLDYIAPIAVVKNGSYDQFVALLDKNDFLIRDGEGIGEGIVIKRYDFVNRHGRTTWAKMVTTDFKAKHNRTMGAPNVEGKSLIEEEAVQKHLTTDIMNKVYDRLLLNSGGEFTNRMIPQLLNTIYHDFVIEEIWGIVKKKNPTINFKTLQHFAFAKIKAEMPHLL